MPLSRLNSALSVERDERVGMSGDSQQSVIQAI